MDQEDKHKSPFDQSLDDARTAATGKENVAETTGGFYRGNRGAASESLSNLEDTAAADSATGAEKSASAAEKASDFVTNVAGKAGPAPVKAAAKTASKLKKYGPIGGILGLILIVGALFMGAQSLAGVGLLENMFQKFGISIDTITERRSTYFIRAGLDSKRNKPITKSGIFSSERFNISKKMQSDLAKNGIEYQEVENSRGEKVKYLLYTNPDSGTATPIVANESDLNSLPDSFRNPAYGPPATTMDAALDSSKGVKGFNVSLEASTRTWRGHVAAGFSSIGNAFFQRRSLSRSTFNGLSDTATDDEVKAAAEKKDKGVNQKSTRSQTEVEDEDGNRTSADGEDDSLRSGSNPDTTASKLTARVRKVAASASGVSCMVLRSIGTINALAAGINLQRAMTYTTEMFSATDQMRSGDGGRAYTYYQNQLQEKSDSTDYKGEVVRTDISAAESAPYNSVFGENLVSSDDGVAMKHSQDYIVQTAMLNNTAMGSAAASLGQAAANFSISATTFQACLGIQIAGGAASAIGDIVLLISTMGTGNFAKGFIQGAVKAAEVAAAIAAVGVVIGLVAPVISDWLTSVPINTIGEDAGHMIYKGGHATYGGLLQSLSGVPASKESLAAMNRANQETIAHQRAYEVATHSPFDVSSQYTFLGSLARSLIPISNSATSSLTAPLSQLASTAKSSLLSLTPLTSALDASSGLGINEGCALLSADNIVGDPYCVEYQTAYIDKLDNDDPADVMARVADGGNFEGEDSSGNPKIKADSDLAKWVVSCAARTDPIGYASANVEGYITKFHGAGGNAVASGLIGTAENFVPGSGLLDIIDASEQATNFDWNTGYICNEAKVADYSTYNIDQTVAEEMGYIDKSAVAVFLEDHYKENPLDNSPEGIIARYSGLTVEEVNDTLGIIEYANYIANYDPTGLGPVTEPEKDAPALAGASAENDVVASAARHIASLADRARGGLATATLRSNAMAVA